MTEADVENINGTSSNVTLVKDAQVIDPKAGNLGAGDSDTKQDDNSDIAKPEGKDVAITDVKCDSPKPNNENEDAQKDGEQTMVNQSQKSDDNQRRGRYHDRSRTSGRFGGRFRISPEEEQRRWEEQQKKKEVLQQGVTGKVKWYSFRKNYGFIQRDDDQQDVFVHQLAIAKSRIRKPTLRTLGHNETVQFDVVQGKKGLEASNVTGPNGTEVQGSHIIFVFKDSFDRPRLPYYNDFNRPAYYNNYLRRPDYRSREVVRPHDRDGSRYQGSRRPFQNNRDRSGYRGERFDRQPYHRQRVYRGRRRSSRSPDPPKEEKIGVKEADASDNKNEVKVNKNGYRRGGRRQFRRSRFFKNNKNQDEGATSAQSDSSTKEATSAKPAEHDKKENQDNTEDIIKGVGAIEVK